MTAGGGGQRPADVLAITRWDGPVLPAGLLDLVAQAEGEGHAWIDAFPADWAASPYLNEGEGLFVVVAGGKPVGMASISAARFGGPDAGRLKHIYVGQGARGRGLLRALVERCLDRAGDRWRLITLHTDNPVAARVYESYGFRTTTAHGHSTHVWERPYSAAAIASSTP